MGSMNHNEYMKEYRKTPKNKEYMKQYIKKYYQDHKEGWNSERPQQRQHYRKLVFDYYGNRCTCCGETEPLFLTIDHINNDGYADKKKGLTGVNLYRKIVKEGFPDTFRILCWNCNCGRSKNNGVCPHERLK